MEVNLDALRGEVEEASQALEAARRTLDEAQEEVAETRRRQLETRSRQEDLRVFAEITLRHLGPTCPVCQQIYDVDSTRERLESLGRHLSPTGSPDNELGLIGS